ncbi:hypothetical protein KUCAC02_010647, partial [Chaenocephalus aceratus]
TRGLNSITVPRAHRGPTSVRGLRSLGWVRGSSRALPVSFLHPPTHPPFTGTALSFVMLTGSFKGPLVKKACGLRSIAGLARLKQAGPGSWDFELGRSFLLMNPEWSVGFSTFSVEPWCGNRLAVCVLHIACSQRLRRSEQNNNHKSGLSAECQDCLVVGSLQHTRVAAKTKKAIRSTRLQFPSGAFA